MDGWTTDAGVEFATDQTRSVDHHVALAEESRGVPPYCQEPEGSCLLPGRSHGGGPCCAGLTGRVANAPPGRTATPVGNTCPAWPGHGCAPPRPGLPTLLACQVVDGEMSGLEGADRRRPGPRQPAPQRRREPGPAGKGCANLGAIRPGPELGRRRRRGKRR